MINWYCLHLSEEMVLIQSGVFLGAHRSALLLEFLYSPSWTPRQQPGFQKGLPCLSCPKRILKSGVIPAEEVRESLPASTVGRTRLGSVTARPLALVEACAVSPRRVMNLDGTSVAFVPGFCLSTLSCLPLCRFLSSFFFFFCQCDILAAAPFGNGCGAC